MQLFSNDPDVPGVFAVGQAATGIFVLAQFGTGVFVVGQFGRGVIVLGQFAVGVISVGQFGVGLISTGGMFAIGGRSIFGLPLLALMPRFRSPRVSAAEQQPLIAVAAIRAGQVDQGWVRVRLAREGGRLVVRTAESFGRDALDATMSAAAVRALDYELDAGREEALVRLLAETARTETSGGFRDAPETTRTISIESVQTIRPPIWQTPFLGAANDAATQPMSVARGSVQIAAWLALCVGWWFAVGQDLLAMFR